MMMQKTIAMVATILSMVPAATHAQPLSSVVPVTRGAYAPASGGCDVAAAAFIYIEDKGIGANKTAGKVLSVKQQGSVYILDVLWIEAGANENDGDRDRVQIEVKDERSFTFSNSTSKAILMRWCS